MKYTSRMYGVALVSLLKGKSLTEQKVIVRRFVRVMRKNCDWARRARIMRAVQRQWLKDQGLTHIRIESPEPLAKDAEKEIKKIFGGAVFLDAHTAPGLLAGIRILIDEETLIDATARRGMDRLFSKK